ncbi:MAG: hypothetical protein A2655_03315 [Candidatus Yanofskybacteria bacterium RIFCSPHIGHO2_01_FULL_43_42]|uniref:Phospholipase C/D domain-containing protein n=1 Tax=Candidatus Yanofskybacteria bacterium RIFCSPLOWO2_01_FULL_43_22 TaxID=1802695 RepID=A0A1F8GET5_9BACT|nr:MAG: hypothetical protein A2655_03315 [Candidatus Yanofskybacteria bacterium RIFCSPHIGHO2_01_FULL_43_42]OGN13026.1 MAG: hypothetical protein A3D48_03975 [Candidatus Yanofskybacteria bacterium RIFCSPHIGHO2_02_FULL_43_17]OGN23894.1 MAG: hypothetical protein A3A13_02285 [Candidatus Yanofskybacteria bacterium RIFCSPLOWO2_01_FULL_43_22]
MAAPITHIVLADKVFDEYFPNLSKDKFLVGTSFPDIRYLRVIKREQTHPKNITLSDIKSVESFNGGLLFHILIDRVRENYMQENDIYSLMPASKLITQTLKLLEDELFYDRLENWGLVSSYFDNVLSEELEYPVKEKDVLKWHKLLQSYLSEKPTLETRKDFFEAIYFTEENAKEVEDNLAIIRSNPKVLEIVGSFYKDFDKLLNNA